MELYELNPHIRYARHHKVSFSSRQDVSICYDCRIFYFEQAAGSMVVNGEKHAVSHQTAVYVPPAGRYRFNVKFEKDTRVTVMDFDLCCDYHHVKASLGTATPKSFDPALMPAYEPPEELARPIVKRMPKLSSLLSECTEAFNARANHYRERASAMLKLCLLELASGDSLRHTELGKRILEYIHEHYERSTLTNEEIATAFNYHPYHVGRIVKKETGLSLKSYIIHYRLRVAKDLLLTTRCTVSDIAFRTGFCSSAYFTKVFKENTGMTPSAYRRLRLHREI